MGDHYWARWELDDFVRWFAVHKSWTPPQTKSCEVGMLAQVIDDTMTGWEAEAEAHRKAAREAERDNPKPKSKEWI